MLIKDIKTPRLIRVPLCTAPHQYDNNREAFISQFLWSERKKVLYVHTPFCVSKCKYCKWQSSVGLPHQVSQHFDTTLPNQIEQYRKVFDKITFDEIYFGGGTPTIATPQELEEFFKKIPHFNAIKNKCIEASPNTLTKEHVELFKKYGFNFISIGIQTLDPMIAMKQNRPYISHQEVANLVDFLLPTGMYINLDMICFMDHGDIRDLPQFSRDLAFLMDDVKPTSITIHQEYNAQQSSEKTKYLMTLIDELCKVSRDYYCVNSRLSPSEVYLDTVYRAEYKIAREQPTYMHHLWDKYNLNLKHDYDVISLGSTHEHPLRSFVGDIIYNEEKDLIFEGPWPEYPPEFYDYLKNFRKSRGWET